MRTFSMPAPRFTIAIALIGVFVLVDVVMASAFAWVSLGSRSVAVAANRVSVKGTLYANDLPRELIDKAGVRVVDLDKAPELALASKSNGLGLPGLKEGWFEMENGKRAFVMLSDQSRVVVVPSSREWLLLSVPDADKLVELLKAP